MRKIPYDSHKQSGYVLFLMMLLIGSLSLYLMYQMSTQKIKTQSWQIQKTATEMSYWMDIERNYVIDNGINTDTFVGQDQMNALTLPNMIANNYLPYGQYRPVTFQSSATPQVSEFLCSPLPGVNATEGALTLVNAQTTCPLSPTSYAVQHCNLDTPAYYSCGNVMADAAKLPVNMRKAQYYINANYIGLGNDANTLAGIGLILRTPGAANSYVSYNGGQMGQLPQSSTAQTLMTLLPTSSFNVYTADVAGVNDIGIASYTYKPPGTGGSSNANVIKNDRYSKIIDMGLVQSTYQYAGVCCGWNGDLKQIPTGLYDGNQDKNGVIKPISNCNTTGNGASLMKNSSGPPTCIKINLKEYGPIGTIEKCNRIDILYTPYDMAQKPSSSSNDAAVWYMDYTNSWEGQDSNYAYVGIGMKEYYNNNNTQTINWNSSKKQNMNNFFVYLVRCTRNPP